MGEASSSYVGIDLGTTNSAVAVFDGEKLELIRNAQGNTLTPSVVRCDARGHFSVGSRARAAAERDPDNVHGEWKRLMGSPHSFGFAASGQRLPPERLAAELLRALREDVSQQLGFLPQRAVIGVPALFELPQTAATSEAARLAGFERVELIQEPVASALAAGHSAEDGSGSWLVYDLGGGTFDVSLLETQEGLLRVVGHDGDNFLGGRDFDAAIVDWAIARLAADGGPRLQREDPGHARALRRLRQAAEEAKIELSRASEAELVVSGLPLGGERVDVELALTRAELTRLIEPLVARSLQICERLLRAHGLYSGVGEPSGLGRVVLVGGPTAIPYLRERLAEALAAPFATGLDPMTLVAQGAALFAASARLDARAPAAVSGAPGAAPDARPRVWLQYPALSADLTPYVVGRIGAEEDRKRVAQVVLRSADGAWAGPPEPVDADGTFAAMVRLKPRAVTRLLIEGQGAQGEPVALSPSSFEIVHGVTIGDPPLARSVGLALGTNAVHVYFERGSPLPMRRTFSVHSLDALHPDDPEGVLRIPIVQGEFPLAHLCRLVGTLEIRARELARPLPVNSRIEVTLELDRGGRVTSSARVPSSEQVFEGVAHLLTSGVPVAELGSRLADLSQRVQTVRARAFKAGARATITRLGQADGTLAEAAQDAARALGEDHDAAEKARRALIEVDAALAEAEEELAWPELDEATRRRIGIDTGWIAQYGTPDERKVLSDALASIERARAARNPEQVRHHLATIASLGTAAYFRDPDVWEYELDYYEKRAQQASDPGKAVQLIERARAAQDADQQPELERLVRQLWPLFPTPETERKRAYASGVR